VVDVLVKELPYEKIISYAEIDFKDIVDLRLEIRSFYYERGNKGVWTHDMPHGFSGLFLGTKIQGFDIGERCYFVCTGESTIYKPVNDPEREWRLC